MHLMLTLLIGREQWTDQQHRSTRGSHDTGQYPAYRQKQGIHPWFGFDITRKMDTARDDIQRHQQNDKGDIVG